MWLGELPFIVKSAAVALTLEFNCLDNLKGVKVHQTCYEGVVFSVNSRVEYDAKLRQNVLIWDMSDRVNRRNYEAARAKQVIKSLPRGDT